MMMPRSTARASTYAARRGLRQRLDLDTERGGPLGHAQPDGAESHDAQGRPEQPSGLAVRFLSHRPARRSATLSGIRRSTASSRPMVSSATAAEFRPGTLATSTPRAAAAAVSMVLVPAPARMTSASRSAASNTLRGDLGAAHDEDVEPRDAAGQVRLAQAGIDHALMATRLELGDGLLRERVGDEYCIPRPPVWGLSHGKGRTPVTVVPRRPSAPPPARGSRGPSLNVSCHGSASRSTVRLSIGWRPSPPEPWSSSPRELWRRSAGRGRRRPSGCRRGAAPAERWCREEPFTGAEHERVHHQPHLVDEVVLDQRRAPAVRWR